MVRRLLIVCNALDDSTRLIRGIATDSPAASRKVFMLCQAIRLAEVRPIIVSLGRGRQDGSGRFFPTRVRRVAGVPVVYAAFWHRAFLSQVISLFAPALILWRARRLSGDKVIVFYNHMPAYIVALVTARLLRLRAVLDLEDGEVTEHTRGSRLSLVGLTRRLFDCLCNGGALLACQSLQQATRLRPVECYYGTVEQHTHRRDWPEVGFAVLMGGTVSREAGAHFLVEAIERMRVVQPGWAQAMRISVTGKGDSIDAFRRLAQQPGWPVVSVHGRTTDEEYRAIVENSQVGLALKPRTGPLANTTFPSKVVELAGAGLLVISTDISDVRTLFENGAVYLEKESSEGLMTCLRWVAENRDAARRTARIGTERIRQRCDARNAGQSLARFLFPTPP
jgi:glycosyltransferase involved in cell wall biosynthesis